MQTRAGRGSPTPLAYMPSGSDRETSLPTTRGCCMECGVQRRRKRPHEGPGPGNCRYMLNKACSSWSRTKSTHQWAAGQPIQRSLLRGHGAYALGATGACRKAMLGTLEFGECAYGPTCPMTSGLVQGVCSSSPGFTRTTRTRTGSANGPPRPADVASHVAVHIPAPLGRALLTTQQSEHAPRSTVKIWPLPMRQRPLAEKRKIVELRRPDVEPPLPVRHQLRLEDRRLRSPPPKAQKAEAGLAVLTDPAEPRQARHPDQSRHQIGRDSVSLEPSRC